MDRFGPGPRPRPPDAEPVTLGPIQIMQRVGQRVGSGEPFPVIEDFGEVELDGDKTFRTSVSFLGGEDGSDDGPGVDDGSGYGFLSVFDRIRDLLPGTGGSIFAVVLGGALLVLAGILLLRFAR